MRRPDDLKKVVAVGIMRGVTRPATIPEKIDDQDRLHRDENEKCEPEDEIQNAVDLLTPHRIIRRYPIEIPTPLLARRRSKSRKAARAKNKSTAHSYRGPAQSPVFSSVHGEKCPLYALDSNSFSCSGLCCWRSARPLPERERRRPPRRALFQWLEVLFATKVRCGPSSARESSQQNLLLLEALCFPIHFGHRLGRRRSARLLAPFPKGPLHC